MPLYLSSKTHSVVYSGLYDPVLDDYEPIYETIDQEDSDQPSQPTEVPDPNTDICPELNNLLQPIQFNGIDPSSLDPDSFDKSFSRSLTASPYVGQAKPYRPFSTEPQEIPTLEEPIILNPDYHDIFKEFGIEDEFLPKTKFKLPISEQYDPEGTKQKIKMGKEVCESIQTNIKETTETHKESTVQEVTFVEQVKKEIDLAKIEKTATSIVEESLEKAVAVTEEIKREIDVELHDISAKSSEVLESNIHISSANTEIVDLKSVTGITVDQYEGKAIITSKQESVRGEFKEATKEVTELVNLIDKTTEEIIKENESIIEAGVLQEEQTQSALVRQKDIIATESDVAVSQKVSENKDEKIETRTSERKLCANKTSGEYKLNEVEIQKSNFKATDIKEKVKIETKSGESKTSDRRSTFTTLPAEKRAYTIGLQTIPNIRGSVHTSYHYNLLLKTFFIHLTDVMVALSRFILSEPVLDKELKQEMVQQETQDIVTETVVGKDERTEVVAKSENMTENRKIYEQKVQQVERKEVAHVVQEKQYEKLDFEELEERRKLSGSRMAQLVEKKSEELTNKMDAVITEFQAKAGIEDIAVQERSSNRSRQEDVIQENAPALGLLSKVDSRKTEEQAKTEISEVTSTAETLTETRKSKERSKSREKLEKSRNTYIAIVESHVYTNKNAILDEQLEDFSETSSVVSAEEVNVAFEASQALSTENVALQNADMKKEVAIAVVEEQQLISAKVEEKFEIVDEQQMAPKNLETVKAVQKPRIVAVKKEEIKSVEQKAEVIDVKQEVQKAEVIEVKQEVQKAEIVPVAKQGVIQKKLFQPVIQPIEKHVQREEVAQIVQKEQCEKEVVIQKKFGPEIKPKEKQEVIRKKLFLPNLIKEVKKEQIQTVSSQSETIKEEKSTKVSVANETIEKMRETETGIKIKQFANEDVQIATYTEAIEQKETVTLKLATDESNAKTTETHKAIKNEIELSQTKIETNIDQETIFVAKTVENEAKKVIQNGEPKLTVKTDQPMDKSDENNNTPTPTPTPTSTVPPTPITDEYMFKLEIALPKRSGTPIPRDCTPTPEDEDPNIVKKKFLPYIDTKIEDEVKYDPPLKSPPTSPKYTKPGLRGGADKPDIYNKVCLLIITLTNL